MIGCGYMYDEMSDDGILVDYAGIRMYVLDDKAHVSWPGSNDIVEPPVKILFYSILF